jgi:pyruvate carboxylase subunit B
MKYIVDVAGERIEVELDGEEAVVDGERIAVHLADIEGTPVRLVTIGTAQHRVIARRGDARGRYVLALDGWRFDIEALDERTRAIRAMAGAAEADTTKVITAPMPGLVVRIAVEVGQAIVGGQGVIVVEAMKMENELKAPADGVVTRIEVVPGQAVEKGAILIVLE